MPRPPLASGGRRLVKDCVVCNGTMPERRRATALGGNQGDGCLRGGKWTDARATDKRPSIAACVASQVVQRVKPNHLYHRAYPPASPTSRAQTAHGTRDFPVRTGTTFKRSSCGSLTAALRSTRLFSRSSRPPRSHTRAQRANSCQEQEGGRGHAHLSAPTQQPPPQHPANPRNPSQHPPTGSHCTAQTVVVSPTGAAPPSALAGRSPPHGPPPKRLRSQSIARAKALGTSAAGATAAWGYGQGKGRVSGSGLGQGQGSG